MKNNKCNSCTESEDLREVHMGRESGSICSIQYRSKGNFKIFINGQTFIQKFNYCPWCGRKLYE